MQEKLQYYKEIKNIIEERETNKRVREIKDNREDLISRWNIGKLIVEAQGGSTRAKYGTALIKEWGRKFEIAYGKSYSYSELRKMRQFFMFYKKCVTLSRISWNHIIAVLPLKNDNERNYYINQVIIKIIYQ